MPKRVHENAKEPKKFECWGGIPKWKKRENNDQVKVKTKWEFPTMTIKREKSKKYDERKERHNDIDPKSLEP
jgi:hypothetical protein